MAKGAQGNKLESSRGTIKQQHGRNMKSSNTNHVGASAKSLISKSSKGNHQNAVKKALIANTLSVAAQNLKSAKGNQAVIRANM